MKRAVSLCGREGCASLVEEAFGLGSLEFLDVVLVFQESTEGVGDDFGGEVYDVEGEQAFGPVDGFGDTGFLEEIFGAQLLDEIHDGAAEGLRNLWRAAVQDGDFAVKVGVIDPVLEAATFERVMHLSRAVGGEDDDGRLCGLDGTKLGDGDLIV